MMFDAAKKILVTGAGGFVGRMLCAQLLNNGYTVSGQIRPGEIGNLSEGVEPVIVERLEDKADWSQELEGVEGVVHLAARVHVMSDASTDPLAEYRRVNVAGTEFLATSCAGIGVKRMVFVSTVKVNGEKTLTNPFSEVDLPDPQDPYSISKWEAEQVLRDIERRTGMEVVIIRPPLVYGPHVGGNLLRLFGIVDRALPLPFGSIQNLRSYIGIDNLVDLIVHCIESPKAAGELFLAADGEDVSTPDLMRKIARLMGRRERLFGVPEGILRKLGTVFGKRDVIDRLAGSLRVDAAKARRVLDWMPPVSFDVGLERTVRWYMMRNEEGSSRVC